MFVFRGQPSIGGVQLASYTILWYTIHLAKTILFDSIGILFLRGETLQHTGNSRGNSTQRILVCEMLVCKMAVCHIIETFLLLVGSLARPSASHTHLSCILPVNHYYHYHYHHYYYHYYYYHYHHYHYHHYSYNYYYHYYHY